MGFLRRLLHRRDVDRKTSEWRKAWTEAVSSPDPAKVGSLRALLDQLTAPDGDLEMEREMLEGLDRMVEFASTVGRDGLPAVPTGHRVVGADVCHFTAPASMPDDPAQPSGRLLLTSARAIFVGGPRGLAVAWHAVAQSLHANRDLVLVRVDGAAIYRFRCNTFGDALCGAFIARQLTGRRRQAPGTGASPL